MPALAAAFPAQRLPLRLALDVALPLATLATILLLPAGVAQYAVFVGGQSHFLMAYLYQYRAGGMTRGYLGFAAALALAAAACVITHLAFWYLLLFADAIFALHFAYDEFTLHGEGFGRNAAAATALFGFVVVGPLLSYLFPALPFAPAVSIALMLAWLAARYVRSGRLSPAEQYLAFLTLVIAALPFFLPLARAWSAAWFLVTFLHYLNWLFVYGIRVQPRPDRRFRYWRDTVVVTGFVLALFAWYWWGNAAFLAALFTPFAFQLWTSAHVLLSVPAFGPRRK